MKSGRQLAGRELGLMHLRRCWLRTENARRREPSGARAFSVNFSATYCPVGRRTLQLILDQKLGVFSEILELLANADDNATCQSHDRHARLCTGMALTAAGTRLPFCMAYDLGAIYFAAARRLRISSLW